MVEMLRGWSAGAPLDSLRDRLGPRAAELAILLPEFGAPPADVTAGAVSGADADAQRFRFFDAVSALLGEIGSDAPVVLVFDDLHWADRPTLQLLRHLVRSPSPRRVLFLGTYRESEISDRHPLHELIGDLRREGTMRRLELSGLTEPEVGELVAELASAPASEAFVRALTGETEGNPFFIEEVVRHIRDTAGALSEEMTLEQAGVPEGVREVTSRRLRRLTESTRAVLLVASVVGREFDYDVLAAVVPQDDDELVEALDEGVEARVLREIGHVGRYGFTHALVRATLYDSISQLRRARLHGRVGEALVSLRGGDLDPHLAMLAHHFAQAAPVERPDRAIDFALAAARRADRIAGLGGGRAALPRGAARAGAVGRGRRSRAGGAAARAGHVRGARGPGGGVARDVPLRDPHRPPARRRRAASRAGRWAWRGRGRRCRARTRSGCRCSTRRWRRCPTRTRRCGRGMLARMSLELYYAGEPELRLSLCDEAVAIARRTGDLRTLATCLDARHYALWLPENVEERLEVAAELRRVAEETGDPELELQGAGWTIIDLMELGDIQGVDIQIAAASKLAEAAPSADLALVDVVVPRRAGAAGRAVRRGRAARPGDAGDRPARPGRERPALLRAGDVQHPPRAGPAGRGRGRRARVHRALSGDPGVAVGVGPDAGRAGPPGRGARGVRGGRFGRLRGVPARRQLADRDHADGRGLRGAGRRARARPSSTGCSQPYAGRNVVVGRNATCNGSASRLLGVLAAAQGSWDVAERHFTEAQRCTPRWARGPGTPARRSSFAEMLLARRGPGDVERASGMLADAILVADALGMVVLAERARRLVPAAASA